jgi:hypothetical protein
MATCPSKKYVILMKKVPKKLLTIEKKAYIILP